MFGKVDITVHRTDDQVLKETWVLMVIKNFDVGGGVVTKKNQKRWLILDSAVMITQRNGLIFKRLTLL